MFLAFGIASLVLSIISIFIPGVGVIIAGLSGFLAWFSIGRGLPFGAAAVILNFINVSFLSPAYLVAVGVQAHLRTPQQSDLFNVWMIVILFQIAAIIIFIFNYGLDIFINYKRKPKGLISSLAEKPSKIKDASGNKDNNRTEPLNIANNESISPAERNIEDIPKAIRVLIHKIHGGRKKDSKFWNSENDLTESAFANIPIQKPKGYLSSRKSSRQQEIFLFSAAFIISITVVMILLRPDLFPFFNYHHIYNSIKTAFPERKNTPNIEVASLPANAKSLPNFQSIPRPETSQPTKEKEIITIASKIQPDTNIIFSEPLPTISDFEKQKYQSFSTAGKVFSWRDKEGRQNFSNTNFPLENETLQVQTEINTYQKVTKIKIIGNQIYVPVTIINKGKEIVINMVLDTGCSQTTIPYKILNSVNPIYSGNIKSTLADGSIAHGKETIIDFLVVGPKRVKDIKITGSEVAGSANKGLLGLNFLKYNPFKIDFEKEMLVWM